MVNAQLTAIRARAAPKRKPNVFTRALEVFGSSGPRTCHPFARKYGILQAVFSHHTPHPKADPALGLFQSKFTVTHPADPTISTTATLIDSRTLPANVQAGDVLRMEVVSSSPRHAVLTVRKDPHLQQTYSHSCGGGLGFRALAHRKIYFPPACC